ncbi:hypothetical protein [Solidesulfovibrio fructosivorans]|uniref:hypothetical protein n=1 Tax=Solidesulfovibrio fructosivorans TaxID=878 RepID=UPI0018F2DF6E|nr:hypothetical protein [Solidesulfovibrio fructosivorans]
MDTEIQVDEKLIEAFHLMFDHFPEGAQLAHKSKKIVALNPACEAIGRKVGMICAKHGPPEAHKGCLANKTIKNHKATWAIVAQAVPGGQVPVTFWLPIDGYPDFFIHFGVGYMKDYAVPPEVD